MERRRQQRPGLVTHPETRTLAHMKPCPNRFWMTGLGIILSAALDGQRTATALVDAVFAPMTPFF